LRESSADRKPATVAESQILLARGSNSVGRTAKARHESLAYGITVLGFQSRAVGAR
jgi:hypothetical protein